MGFKLLPIGFQAHIILAFPYSADYRSGKNIAIIALRKNPAILLVLLPELLFASTCYDDMLAIGSESPCDKTLGFEPFQPAGCRLLADSEHFTYRLR